MYFLFIDSVYYTQMQMALNYASICPQVVNNLAWCTPGQFASRQHAAIYYATQTTCQLRQYNQRQYATWRHPATWRQPTNSVNPSQSPDFYGILASWMVGRLSRKVGRSGKSHVSCHIFRDSEKRFLKGRRK